MDKYYKTYYNTALVIKAFIRIKPDINKKGPAGLTALRAT
ncbi:hypothetical protein J2Z29_002317 [Treponema pedis]